MKSVISGMGSDLETRHRLVWKRGAIVVVSIEFLTALTGLVNKVSQLVRDSGVREYAFDLSTTSLSGDDAVVQDLASLRSSTFQERRTKYQVRVAFSLLISFVVIYVLMAFFNLLLIIGIKKSKTVLLRVWHRFSIVLIAVYILGSLIEATAAPEKSSVPPELIIRIFLTWILDEYLKSIEEGAVHSPGPSEVLNNNAL